MGSICGISERMWYIGRSCQSLPESSHAINQMKSFVTANTYRGSIALVQNKQTKEKFVALRGGTNPDPGGAVVM